MNPRERYIAVLEHREPDEFPCHFTLHPTLIPKVLALYGVPSSGDLEKDSVALSIKTGETPIAGAGPLMPKGWKIDPQTKTMYDYTIESPGPIKNPTSYAMAYASCEELGVRREIGATIPGTKYRQYRFVYHPLAPGNTPLDEYEFPDIDAPGRFDEARRVVKEYKDTLFCEGYLLNAYFRHAWMLRGFLQFMKDVYIDPAFVKKLMGRLVERAIRMVEHFADCGVDAIAWNEDSGNNVSLFINYKKWKELIKPGYKAINDVIHKHGMWSLWHGDGNLTEIVPDLIEVGFDSMNPLQPEVMDVYEIKKKYGDKLVIDTGYPVMTLPFNTPEEVKERTKKDIKVLAPGGGFVYGTSHMCLWETPAQNVFTLAETVRKYAKYPIKVP